MLHPGSRKKLQFAAVLLVALLLGFLIYSHLHKGLGGSRGSENTLANRPDSANSHTAQPGTDSSRSTGKRVVSLTPEPPPKGLKFYGYAKKPNESEQVFISEGDNVFIGRQGDIVGRHYKITRITKNSVELENLLNNRRLTLPLPKEAT